MGNKIDQEDIELLRMDKKTDKKNRSNRPKKQTEDNHQHRQPQRGSQKSLAQAPFDMETLNKLAHTPLPAGLKFPKDLSLEQLQHIINEFHTQETRTDLLSDLPLDFEPEKSVFSFLYTMNTFKDPSVVSRAYLMSVRVCWHGACVMTSVPHYLCNK